MAHYFGYLSQPDFELGAIFRVVGVEGELKTDDKFTIVYPDNVHRKGGVSKREGNVITVWDEGWYTYVLTPWHGPAVEFQVNLSGQKYEDWTVRERIQILSP